jgi:hypothetical protein
MKKILALISFCLSITLISGCGGGGGGGGTESAPVVSTSTFSLRNAWINYLSLKGSKQFTLQRTVNGVTSNGSGTASFGGLLNSTFFGDQAFASATTITGSYASNGQNTPFASTSTYYVDSNALLLGLINDDQGVVLNLTARSLPATVKVGDTGTLFQTTRYTTYTRPTQFNPYPFSNSTTIQGTSSFTFVVEPDTASTAILKIIAYDKDTKGSDAGTSTTKLRITPDGSVTYISETTVVGSNSVVLTFQ